MYQSESVLIDTVAADSAMLPPAFFPLHDQSPFPFPYTDALKQSLDSAVCMSSQHLKDSDSGRVAIQLFKPVMEKTALPKPVGNQTAVVLLFCLYGLLVSLNRLRYTRGSDFSSRKVGASHLFPRFFVRQMEAGVQSYTLRALFVPICVGFALCLSVFSPLFGSFFPAYLSVAVCVGYGLFKLLSRLMSAQLLDVGPLSADFTQRKWIAYYNLLLLFVPFVFLYFIYPFLPVFYLFCLLMTVVFIYLIISAITIFSSRLKLHGIFLYFCTLEIVPLILIAVYFLRY